MSRRFILGLVAAFICIIFIGSVSAVGVLAPTGFTKQGTDAGQSGIRGLEFVMNSTPMLLMNATVDADTTMELARLCADKDCSSIIATSTSKVGNTFFWSTPPTLSAFGTYYILATTATTAAISFTNAPPSYPVVTQYLNYTRSDTTGTLGTGNMWAFTSMGLNTIGVTVNLTNPANNSGYLSLSGVTFNATLIPDAATIGATNATFFLYSNAGALLSTTFTDHVPQNKSNFTIAGLLSDGNYRWNVRYGVTDGTSSFAPANFTFSLDSASPSVNGALPLNNSYIYSLNSTFVQFLLNITATDSVGVASVWYNSTWDSTIRLVANAANTMVNLTNVFGKHQIYRFANDSAGNMAMNQTTIWIHRNIFSNETYETDSETISLELWNLTATPTSPVLAYNGTNRTPTVTSMGNGKYSLNTTFDISLGAGNRSFHHYFNDGVARVSSSLNQSVASINFSMCTGTTPPKYLNISFKNETVSQEVVNASIASSLFSYWLGSGGVSKNYSFSTATEQRNYTFCFTPGHRTLNIFESVSYANSLSAQRTFSSTISATNSTTQQTLYLLPNSLGIFVTFQIINPALQPIEGVSVSISSGAFGSIETKTTDASGAVTFFLNPLVSYNLLATKAGLPSYSTSLTPTQSEYTITMGLSSTNTTVQDYYRGIVYSISPGQIYLTNGTSYQFNFSLASSFWELDSFGFSIRNASGSQFGSNMSLTSSGGVVSLNRNVGRNLTLIVDTFWIIQGNTTNVSKTFVIFDSSGTGTSLANLRDRIRTYIDAGGFFGLQPFGLNIIVFLGIFCVTGIASWKFGFTSPFAVFALMFAVTVVFDYMNLITYAEALPEDAASLIVMLLTLVFGIREAIN